MPQKDVLIVFALVSLLAWIVNWGAPSMLAAFTACICTLVTFGLFLGVLRGDK